MSTTLTPEQVREFLTGEHTPATPRGLSASEASGGDYEQDQPPVVERRKIGAAVERAKAKGWSIEPVGGGAPHEWNACLCRARRLKGDDAGIRDGCQCVCHGRTFVHYRRGA
jgi:hypothetical protein